MLPGCVWDVLFYFYFLLASSSSAVSEWDTVGSLYTFQQRLRDLFHALLLQDHFLLKTSGFYLLLNLLLSSPATALFEL